MLESSEIFEEALRIITALYSGNKSVVIVSDDANDEQSPVVISVNPGDTETEELSAQQLESLFTIQIEIYTRSKKDNEFIKSSEVANSIINAIYSTENLGFDYVFYIRPPQSDSPEKNSEGADFFEKRRLDIPITYFTNRPA